MRPIFLFHGAYGNPEENWFPWLKGELEKSGYSVYVPRFPTPENQSLKQWHKIFEPYEKFITKDSLFVGHSLGPAFILSILEELDFSITSTFFVSGFLNLLGHPDFDDINRSFVEKKFDWEKIKKNSRNFTVIHSDNDPYVPVSEAEKLAKMLEVKPEIIENAGHFNQAAGYTKFPWLLEQIKSI